MRSLEPCARLMVIGTPPRPRGPSGSPSGRSRASPARSARRSAAAAPPSSSTSPRARRAGCSAPWRSCCRRSRRTSPGRWSGRHHAGHSRSKRDGRLTGCAAGRQGRPGHRGRPRDRRADRPGAAPRRRHRDRRRRTAGRRRPGALTNELDGDYLALDITARTRRSGSRTRCDRARRRRHRGAQRRHHPRQEARQHGRGPLGTVIGVNLTAPERITRELLARRRSGRRPRSSASPRSPASRATSARRTTPPPRPGVIGLVDSLGDELPDGITVNAVAPGFIETQMTAAVPFATREVGRRLNA